MHPLCHHNFTCVEIFYQNVISYAAQILYSGWSLIFNNASDLSKSYSFTQQKPLMDLHGLQCNGWI